MRKRLQTFLVVLFVMYPFGIILVIKVIMLRAFGFMRIINWNRFPHFKEGIIVVCNHPSIIDEFFVAALFCKGFFINPFRYRPLLVVDESNFYNSWYFFLLRDCMISTKRGDSESEAAAFRQMAEAIKNGRVVIIFAEGGRTFKGKDGELRFSDKGNKIRRFKHGVGLLVKMTGALVLPIWIKGTDDFFLNSNERLFSFAIRTAATFSLKIGHLINFKEKSKKEKARQITERIEGAMLQLADE